MRFKRSLITDNELCNLKTKSGVTLIELIVATAIMSMVMSSIFGIYLFSVKTYKAAEINSKNQFEVRMAAEFITKELRYATSTYVLASPVVASADYYDIYLKTGSIMFNKKGVPTIPAGLNNVTDFTLSFSSTNNIIIFTIGKTGNTKYNIDSKVILLNIPNISSLNFTTSGIRYARQP